MSTSRNVQVDFGGMFSRPPPVTLWLMIATAVLSVACISSLGVGDGTVARLLLFSPAGVFDELRVWTPVTYLFVEPSPLSLVFHMVFMLWVFGAQVERQWGPGRYLFYLATASVGASLLTVALGLALPDLAQTPQTGAYVLSATILLGWVLANWHASAFFFFFPIRAPWLLAFTFVFIFLSIVSGHWRQTVPVLLSMALGFLLLNRGLTPRRLRVRLRAWWIERGMHRRARHLRVVKPPDPDRGPDDYLH